MYGHMNVKITILPYVKYFRDVYFHPTDVL